MSPQPQSEITVRVATPEDASVCGQICYKAFSAISNAHNFPPDFDGPEGATRTVSSIFASPDFYCVVAEADGKIIGSNGLDQRSVIYGVGPITVDPDTQNRGAGRKLMQAVMDRAIERGAPGVRLVQAAFHNRSLSLYTSLGFAVREPLSCMQRRSAPGTAGSRDRVPGCAVRPADADDLDACNAICRNVHGFDRGAELSQAIGQGRASVVERGGRITGYATALAFFGHAVAETNPDLQALIASADSFAGAGILVPSRNTTLFRWCLENGLRVVQPMTLMSVGLYSEPAGAWLPSVLF